MDWTNKEHKIIILVVQWQTFRYAVKTKLWKLARLVFANMDCYTHLLSLSQLLWASGALMTYE